MIPELKHFQKAKELNERFKNELLGVQALFRGNDKNLKLISLNSNTPQLGLKFHRRKLNNDPFNDIVPELQYLGPPRRPTPEKSLQSWVVLKSLQEGYLPFGKNIQFITDELVDNYEGKKIVLDIVGFNDDSKSLCLIELKSNRAKTDLTNQLSNSYRVVENNLERYRSILNLHGLDWREPYKIRKIAVWPREESKRVRKFDMEEIEEFTYSIVPGGYNFY